MSPTDQILSGHVTIPTADLERLRAIEAATRAYAAVLHGDRQFDVPACERAWVDVVAALAAVPVAEMPEPWPGMVYVTVDRSTRSGVVTAYPPVAGRGWVILTTVGQFIDWDAKTIREVRTPDGQVLWRAPNPDDRSAM